ncbi:hypothetical protein [Streptomyces sp. NPDC001404]|uniref:hypothetical protein n=1 Tax=Streptomyces sp. NPDC001404 TaxID=3364571 RepID=UPI0036C42638
MSGLTKLHDVLARVFDIGRADAEDVVKAVTEAITPILHDAVAQAKADEKRLASAVAAEVAVLLGHQPAPAPTPPSAPAPQQATPER